MAYLTTGDIAQMRTTVVETLPDTVVVQRATFAASPLGGSIPTWAAIGTAAARVDPINRRGQEYAQSGREIGDAAWVVVMAYNGTVTASDRIVHQGRTLEILEVRTPQTWQLLTRCECAGLS